MVFGEMLFLLMKKKRQKGSVPVTDCVAGGILCERDLGHTQLDF
jgi:hypothetical protein